MDTLSLVGYDGFDFAVANLARSRRFYVDRLDWQEVARSTAAGADRDGQETAVFAAGEIRVAVHASLRGNSSTARYLFGEGNFRALFEAIEREQFLAHASPMG